MVLNEMDHLGPMWGSSPAMRSVYDRIRKAAVTDVTVLLTGESGTGKELAARAIRDLSDRADGPFIPVNAGAIPPDLTAAELFGHEVGAFTGAGQQRKGKFEAAHHGTLFLDEIGATDHATQVALLRALEGHAITRLGGHEEIPVDVRFIAATNQSLTRLIKEKRFREDLYYRLDVFQIRMPPLRDRGRDVEVLAQAFLKEAVVELKRDIKCFTPDALYCINGYSWPGNVRELRNCVQRAVVNADNDVIQRSDLPKRLQKVSHATRELRFKLNRKLGDIEKAYVMQTLEEFGGNKKATSEALGISRKALYEKIARWKKQEGDGDVYFLGDEETMPITSPPPSEEE